MTTTAGMSRSTPTDRAGSSAMSTSVARVDLRRPDGSPVRVLVVDDETTLSDLLSMALHYEGWEVRTAADGRAAVRIARDFRPDAVVLDVMLPDIDGLEVLRRLRAESPHLSLIHISEPTRLGMISYAVFCLKKKK